MIDDHLGDLVSHNKEEEAVLCFFLGLQDTVNVFLDWFSPVLKSGKFKLSQFLCLFPILVFHHFLGGLRHKLLVVDFGSLAAVRNQIIFGVVGDEGLS